MNRKEKILSYIQSKEYIPLKTDELAAVLAVPNEAREILVQILDELVSDGKITKTSRGRYCPNTEASSAVSGTISCSAHGFFAFFIPDNSDLEDVYISGEKLFGALDGDRVAVKLDKNSDNGKRCEGRVIKILERANSTVTGVVKRKKHDYYIICPDSPKIYANIEIFPENMLSADVGSHVAVEITSYLPALRGSVIKVFGSANEIKGKLEAVLFSEGISESFPEEVLSEAKNIPLQIDERDISERLDLRKLLTFTIDGDDARDFDDAVSLEITKNGNYRLGVHIADVTHYVKKNSPLDREALARGTSIYLPDRVIPMLPEKLSNGLCSLNPNEDRLTLSVFMVFSPNGKMLSHELYKSVIRSHERMTYTDTAALLEEPSKELLAKYGYLLPTLKHMKELSALIRGNRKKRGSIDFDFPEAKILVNKKGEPIDIIPEKREISNNIIEDFMLCANETIAEYAFWAEIPFVYRVHEPPSFENMRNFQKFISVFGLGIKEKFSETEPIHPRSLRQISDKIKGTKEEHMISVFMLRSLMKAEYKDKNLGHFGLAAKYYCHFTSPIRRYPDLTIHRILKDFIDGKNLEDYEKATEEIAKKSSNAEIKAQNIEHDVDDILKACYMSQYTGYIFDAKISSITEFGIFAELENTVEGLIRVENIKDDYYIFDSDKKTLVGRHSQKVFKIGDIVEVAVANCDINIGKIEFILAENATTDDIDRLQKKEYKRKREREKKIKNPHRTFKKRRSKR